MVIWSRFKIKLIHLFLHPFIYSSHLECSSAEAPPTVEENWTNLAPIQNVFSNLNIKRSDAWFLTILHFWILFYIYRCLEINQFHINFKAINFFILVLIEFLIFSIQIPQISTLLFNPRGQQNTKRVLDST